MNQFVLKLSKYDAENIRIEVKYRYNFLLNRIFGLIIHTGYAPYFTIVP